jgi:uroporphyrinogen-III synthase
MPVRVFFSKELSKSRKERLFEAGFEPVDIPLIRTEPVHFDRSSILRFSPDFILLSSRNGVRYFFSEVRFEDVSGASFIAVGSSTADELIKVGVKPLVPDKFSGEGLIDLLSKFDLEGKKFLIVRPKVARSIVSEFLRRKKARVKEVIVYQTLFNSSVKEELIKELKRRFDFFVFTSPSTFRSYLDLSGEPGKRRIQEAKVIPIGDVTAKAIDGEGFKIWKIPEKFTLDGVIDILLEWKSK